MLRWEYGCSKAKAISANVLTSISPNESKKAPFLNGFQDCRLRESRGQTQYRDAVSLSNISVCDRASTPLGTLPDDANNRPRGRQRTSAQSLKRRLRPITLWKGAALGDTGAVQLPRHVKRTTTPAPSTFAISFEPSNKDCRKIAGRDLCRGPQTGLKCSLRHRQRSLGVSVKGQKISPQAFLCLRRYHFEQCLSASLSREERVDACLSNLLVLQGRAR